MWQTCVAAAPAERLRPSRLVSAAQALHEDGRTPEALRLLATLLVTEPGRAPDVDAELDQALVDAEAFHRGLPDGSAAAALFAARRELLAPS